jgi:hypothetical protein
MGQVIGETVWVGTRMVEAGTRREDLPAEVASSIGEHNWAEESTGLAVSASGQALTGLRSTVHIDGKQYDIGTVPPDDVLPKVGAHLWVPGFVPPIPATAAGSAGDEVDQGSSPGPGVAEVSAIPADGVEGEAPEDEGVDLADDQEVVDSVPPATESDTPKAPPLRGPGSSETAWRAYAKKLGIHVDDANDKTAVVAAIDEELARRKSE